MAEHALVVGLDGVPLTLLEELAARGVMPAVGELLSDGTPAELVAPVPEISSTSWASFLTGTNPGRHGVLGFVDVHPDSYQAYFPNLSALDADPLWVLAARGGLSTACLNVPGTYPAPSLPGILISGFVAPSIERAVSTPRLLPVLEKFDYRLDVEPGDVTARPEDFVARLGQSVRSRRRTFEHLLRTERWQVAVAVLTETDRLQHFLWQDVADPGSPRHELVLGLYREVDAAVAALVDAVPAGTALFLVSDHGFGPAHCQFHLNAWLRERGLLPPLADVPTLSGLDERARAFGLDPGRVYLHQQEFHRRGPLSVAAAEELADELAAELAALRWADGRVGPDADGPRLLTAVHRREEVYLGPHTARAANLILEPAPGVQLRGTWRARDVLGTDVFTGTHTRGNAVFHARGGDSSTPVSMYDVAPTVLAAVGVHAPELDGRDLLAPARTGPPTEHHGGST